MTLYRISRVGALLGCLFATLAWADANPLARALARLEHEAIEHDPSWIALLHYRGGADAYISQASQRQFFLSPNGPRSPRAELMASIHALHRPDTQQQFACRFPARFEWLISRLQIQDASARLEHCPELAAWLAPFSGSHASIVFASSFLESPSSTFGHTFLKLTQDPAQELLSPTINYAARTDQRSGDIDFIVRGLAGGFPGAVDVLPFYRRLRTYTQIEGRDLHEFSLALTSEEIRRLLLHTWEIKDGVFNYYFLDENCAYRTLALLDVARPQAQLLDRFGAVTVPIDTIRALRHAGMLGEHRVWGSAPKRIRAFEAQLGEAQVEQARRMAMGRDHDTFLTPAPAAPLQLAFEYGALLIERDLGERATRKQTLGAIARQRLQQGDAELALDMPTAPNPEPGHDGGLLAIGLQRQGQQHGLQLELAAFSHTLTDPLSGYEANAEIQLLNPTLQLNAGRLRLASANWLVVQSTIPSTTLFSPRAWRLALTTSDQSFHDRRHLATGLAYHSGVALPVTRQIVFAILPGASLEASAAHRHYVALAASLRTLLSRQGTVFSGQLELTGEQFLTAGALRRVSVSAAAQLRLSRNISIALTAQRQQLPWKENQLGISLQWRHQPLTFRRTVHFSQ